MARSVDTGTTEDAGSAEANRFSALGASWTDHVGRPLRLSGFGRPVGRMFEAGCNHDVEGWNFSYLAATPEAAFAGLTQMVSRRLLDNHSSKRYAHR